MQVSSSANQWDPRNSNAPGQAPNAVYRDETALASDPYSFQGGYPPSAHSHAPYPSQDAAGSTPGLPYASSQPGGYRAPSPTSMAPGSTASASYRSNNGTGYAPPPVGGEQMPLSSYHRSSVSSNASGTDYHYGGGNSTWSSNSPATAAVSHPGTRNNSVYSLDGQMGGLGMTASHSLDAGNSGQQTSQYAPPNMAANTVSNNAPFAARYPPQANYVDRRFSLDDRIRPTSASTGTKTGALAGTSPAASRQWPWAGPPGHNGSGNQTPVSRASYDYSAMGGIPGSTTRGIGGAGYSAHDPPWAVGGQDGASAARIRSMSSSAASGRNAAHPYMGYGVGGSAAAAMGLLGNQGPGNSDYLPADSSTSSSLSKDSNITEHRGPPTVGPGGGVTRRAKFKRSRTGCLVCRKRKVKCSQDGTPCKQCRIGKRDCYYQEHIPKRKRKSKGDTSLDSQDDTLGEADEDDDEQDDDEDDKGGFGSKMLAPSAMNNGRGLGGSSTFYQQGQLSESLHHPSHSASTLPPPSNMPFSMPFTNGSGSSSGSSSYSTSHQHNQALPPPFSGVHSHLPAPPPPPSFHGSHGNSHLGHHAPAHEDPQHPSTAHRGSATFGSAGWPVPPGEASHRGSFDGPPPRSLYNEYEPAPQQYQQQQQRQQQQPPRGSYDPSLGGPGPVHHHQGGSVSSTSAGPSSDAGSGSAPDAGNAGWYDPVSGNHHVSNTRVSGS